MSTDYSAAITNIYIALADFALKNSNNPGARQIYAPFDATAPIAFELARRGKAVAFEVESAAIHYVVHTLSWAADWPLEARLGSPVLEPSWVEDGSLRVFQGAVCVSPFGRRYDRKVLANDRFERFPEGLFQGELAVVAHAISQSPEFAFIIVPEAVLLRTAGPDRDFKARLLREGRISHIIKMPRGMFHSTGVEASILVLSGRRANDRVRVCDARKYYHPKNREGRKLVGWNPQGLEQLIHDLSSLNEHDEARFVAFDEFESNDFNLGVDRYLKPERQRQIERILAKHRAHPLGDVAEIIRPQLIKRTEDGELELRELSPADLTVTGAFNLPKTPVYFEAGDERRASRQMLRVGDVLLTVRGAVGRVGLVTQELIAEYESASDKRGTYLCPSQAFVILRLRQSGPVVDARVLLRFLVSPLGQQLLSDVTAGTAVPNIPMGDLKALPVLAATETEAREVLRAEFDTQTLHKKIAELRGQIDEIDRKAWPMKLFSEFIETSIDES
jgi:type I restriction-modification system DNA methylase subunit